MPMILRLIVFLLFIVNTGCATLQPDQSFSEDADIKALEQRYGQASALPRYFEASFGTCSNDSSTHCKTSSDCPAVKCEEGVCSDGKGTKCKDGKDCATLTCSSFSGETKAARNEFIAGRLTLINLQYMKFVRQFAVSRSETETAFDLLMTGVGLTTAVAGGEAVKAALGASSAGLGATRTSIDKNFFYEKTAPVLVTAMNAQRKVALVPILTGIKQDIETYPMAQALTDLSEYFFAGTFMGALQAMQKDAAAKEQKADEKIEIVRDPRAAEILAQSSAKVRVLQKKVEALSDSAAIALAKSPPVADSGGLADLVNKTFPSKRWETDPAVARDVSKMRITLMRNPEVDLPQWEKALP